MFRAKSQTQKFASLKQKRFTIYTKLLSSKTKCDNFKVRKARNNTSTGHISAFIYQIFGKFLAYVKNFSELCNQVAHDDDVLVVNFVD